mgnify:CR=1 FL=1
MIIVNEREIISMLEIISIICILIVLSLFIFMDFLISNSNKWYIDVNGKLKFKKRS